MAALGDDLKTARENKGLTLADVAKKTRISQTFLKALEEGDYSVIPGEVFVTGFLRTYAKELNLNAKEIVARYREQNPPKSEPAPQEAAPVQHKPKLALIRVRRGEKGKRLPLYLIILAGLVLGTILTGVTLLLTPKEQLPTKTNAVKAAPATAAPFAPHTTAFKPATSAVHAVPNPPAAPTALVLKVMADDRTWYSYRADRGERQRGTLEKGGTLDIKADKRILLDLGNAGAVRLEYNGKVLKPIGRAGFPTKNILFTKDVAGAVQAPKKPFAAPTSVKGR